MCYQSIFSKDKQFIEQFFILIIIHIFLLNEVVFPHEKQNENKLIKIKLNEY